jgi:hypothetical protein
VGSQRINGMNEREEGYMQQHLCECMIDNNGEKTNVLLRDASNPVPWPEILVLQAIHGEQSIYDIKPVALGPRESPLREKDRMALIYGRDTVEQVYSGKGFHMEWFVPGWPIDPAKAKRKPKPTERPARTQIRPPDEEALDARI